MITRLPLVHCPRCGTMLDAASSVNGERIEPVVGDVTVCFTCCDILQFTTDMELVKADLMSLDQDTRLLVVAAATHLKTQRILDL